MAVKLTSELAGRVDSWIGQIDTTNKEQRRLGKALDRLKQNPERVSRKQFELIMKSPRDDVLDALLPFALNNNLKALAKVTRSRDDAFLVWQNMHHLKADQRLQMLRKDPGLADRLLSSQSVRNEIEQDLCRIVSSLDHPRRQVTKQLLAESPEFTCAVLKRDGYFYNPPTVVKDALAKQYVQVNQDGLKQYQAWATRSSANWIAQAFYKILGPNTFTRFNWLHPVSKNDLVKRGSLFKSVTNRLNGVFEKLSQRSSSHHSTPARVASALMPVPNPRQIDQHQTDAESASSWAVASPTRPLQTAGAPVYDSPKRPGQPAKSTVYPSPPRPGQTAAAPVVYPSPKRPGQTAEAAVSDENDRHGARRQLLLSDTDSKELRARPHASEPLRELKRPNQPGGF